MASTLLKPRHLRMPSSTGIVIGFWIVTALFCLQMSFTAYAQLRLPQVAESFTRLGLPEGSYAGHLFNGGNTKV